MVAPPTTLIGLVACSAILNLPIRDIAYNYSMIIPPLIQNTYRPCVFPARNMKTREKATLFFCTCGARPPVHREMNFHTICSCHCGHVDTRGCQTAIAATQETRDTSQRPLHTQCATLARTANAKCPSLQLTPAAPRCRADRAEILDQHTRWPPPQA